MLQEGWRYNMAQRILQIDLVDLDTVPNFEVDSIKADATPSREIAKYNLAWQDGSIVINSLYRDKKIFAFGHINAGSLEGYELSRDALLSLLQSNTAYRVTLEQGGGFRRYQCMHETTQFDYKGDGFAMVTITFDTTSPFGEDPNYTTPVQETGIISTYETTFTTLGSIYTPARVFIQINTVDPLDESREFTFINSTSGKTYELTIDRIWADDDTILIDGANQKVYVNDGLYPYSGRFPIFNKNNTFQVFDNANSSNIDITVQYNRRFL